MNEEEILKLVHTLIGKTEPVGDTAVDDIRKANVKKLIAIMKELHEDIHYMADKYSKSQYLSEKEIANECNGYLDWLGISNNQ